MEALNNIRNHQWDVVILNDTIPGRGSLEILKTIKIEKPKLPVIVRTWTQEMRSPFEP
ncbi:hypothetical protein MNBD_ALPHA03-278, partial [hydrothermal vent metagenome]